VTNVLVFMSDEHNPKFASVYGHPRLDTPNMERLAATGVTYEAAYCPSPLCSPSRTSFLSGLPTHRAGIYNNCRVEDLDHSSYGGVLASQAVHTVNIGKTDVYAPGDRLGFSEMRLAGDRNMPGDTNFCRDPLSIRDDGPGRAEKYGPRPDAFAKDDTVTNEAVEWLTTSAPEIGKPWTLTVNIIAPHFPHYATPDLWDKYEGMGDLPAVRGDADTANHPYAQDLRRHFQTDTFSDEQIRRLRQGYLARIDYVDQQLGRLLDTLESTGQIQDTVVAYTSDHGEMLGKFDMWWKCSMYEDSVRIPLMVSGPGFPQNARSTSPVTLLDLQASLFHATGSSRPCDWWGEPLQDIPLDDPSRVAFGEYHGHGTRGGTFMIRKGSWKLLYHELAPHQLFDLATDPDELVNRYQDDPEFAADLERELRDLCSPEEELDRARAHELHLLDQLQRLSA
jgi:choline-sulfatase